MNLKKLSLSLESERLNSRKLLEKLRIKASEIAMREFPKVDKDVSMIEALRLMERFKLD